MPPAIRLRWKSATSEPMYRLFFGLHPVGHVALEAAHGGLHAFVPAPEVALVHAVVLADPGRDDAGMGEQKLADRGIEREAVHPLPRRVHQHRARPVHHVAGGDLLAPRLQHVAHRAPALHAHPAVDAEDGADRGIDVDVGGAVERDRTGPRTCRPGYSGGTGMMSSSSSEPITHTRPVWLRQFLMVSLAMTSSFCCSSPCTLRLLGAAEDVHQAGAPDRRGDDLRRERDVVQQIGQLARRLRIAVLLVEDEPLDGGHGSLHAAPAE